MTRSAYVARESWTELPPAQLAIFEEFATIGAVCRTDLTERQAKSLRARIYRLRLMLQRAAQTGDPIAADLYEAAQYMYVAVRGSAAAPSIFGPAPLEPVDWILTITIDPALPLADRQTLPWKKV